jgi:tetratricopeptide (TPR) repeat protein
VNLGPFAGLEHRQKGRAHLRAGTWQKAVEEANRAIERFAADGEAWRLRAEARMGLKQYDQALADYQHALTLGARNAETENNLAWRLVVAPGVEAGLVARAVKLARGATALAPAQGTYWNTLGVAHYRAGNWDEAIQALRKSDQVMRGRDRAHNGFFLSMAYARRGDRALARRWQENAIGWMEKHEPDNPELRRFRDEAAACLGEALRQELEKLTRAVEHRPKDAKAHFERGEVHFHLRQYEQARDDYSRALALGPGHVGAYHQRGHAFQRLGQFDKMRDDFAEALRRTPDEARLRGTRAHFHDMLGLAHYRLEDHAKAIADWQKSLELMPKQPQVCRDLAWLYVTGPEKLRDAAKALPLAERAVQLAPGTYSYLHTLGVVHYRLGEYEKAIEHLTRAAAARRQGPAAWDRFFLAMSYHRQGDAGKAREYYDEAVAWCQAHPEVSAFQAEQLRAIRTEAEALLPRP